jgi:hypothetical protein
MNKFQAIIKAIEQIDKLLNTDGTNKDIINCLLGQRRTLIEQLCKMEVCCG